MTDASTDPRQRWVALAGRLAGPVLTAGAQRRLREAMPVEVAPGFAPEDRLQSSHFEAVSRLLAGLAPWLELPDDVGDRGEVSLRSLLRDQAREALRSGIDPSSPDRFIVEGPQGGSLRASARDVTKSGVCRREIRTMSVGVYGRCPHEPAPDVCELAGTPWVGSL